jgi:hypothetical protein
MSFIGSIKTCLKVSDVNSVGNLKMETIDCEHDVL